MSYLLSSSEILQTIEMINQQHLDVRTVTMGISLLDCIDPDPRKACEKIYNKITTRAARLVPAVEHISAEYGIPIINKRISVTPIAMLLGACPDADPVDYAKALDKAAKAVGEKSIEMIRLAELQPLTGYVHGGCSPVGMKKQFPTVFHETVELFDTICVSAGKIGAQVEVAPADLIALLGAQTADVTAE